MSDRGAQTREKILIAAEPLVLKQGFAGTSLDDVLKAAGVTKGAFFHHFQGKGDLARALIERVVREDFALFRRFLDEAEAESDDPLEQTFLFLDKFEALTRSMDGPPAGCIFAVYTYESMHFDPSIAAYVTDSFRRWTDIYEKKFEAVLAKHKPARPATARQLADMVITTIEGAFVLARAYNDAGFMGAQTRQLRQYLELLFGRGADAQASRPAA